LTPRMVRCQWSCSSHSAIDTLKVFWTRALMVRSTLRLPFSEWFSGSSSSRRSTPTTMRGGSPPGSGLALCGLRTSRWRRGQPAGPLLHLVALDDVADLDVLERLQPDAALVPARHLAHVLLEAPQAGDPTVVHHHVVPQQACLGAAHELAVDDEAARNDALP